MRRRRSPRLHLEPDHGALFPAELHADQMDRLPVGPVLVGVAPVLDLLQGPALGFQMLYGLLRLMTVTHCVLHTSRARSMQTTAWVWSRSRAPYFSCKAAA